MELCIEEDLKSIGIKDDNIYSLNYVLITERKQAVSIEEMNIWKIIYFHILNKLLG